MMARLKNDFPSERIRLDANLRMQGKDVTLNPRHQVFYDWYQLNKKDRQAATLALEIMTSMLLGELGPQVKAAVAEGNTAEAIDALQDLLGAFGG